MPQSFSIKLHSETQVSGHLGMAKPKSPAIWACLGVDPQDMPRTPYRASKGKRSQ